ncbi:hypothetical protein JCM10450v2_005082 [Rhodotorula kratochvilovae]
MLPPSSAARFSPFMQRPPPAQSSPSPAARPDPQALVDALSDACAMSDVLGVVRTLRAMHTRGMLCAREGREGVARGDSSGASPLQHAARAPPSEQATLVLQMLLLCLDDGKGGEAALLWATGAEGVPDWARDVARELGASRGWSASAAKHLLRLQDEGTVALWLQQHLPPAPATTVTFPSPIRAADSSVPSPSAMLSPPTGLSRIEIADENRSGEGPTARLTFSSGREQGGASGGLSGEQPYNTSITPAPFSASPSPSLPLSTPTSASAPPHNLPPWLAQPAAPPSAPLPPITAFHLELSNLPFSLTRLALPALSTALATHLSCSPHLLEVTHAQQAGSECSSTAVRFVGAEGVRRAEVVRQCAEGRVGLWVLGRRVGVRVLREERELVGGREEGEIDDGPSVKSEERSPPSPPTGPPLESHADAATAQHKQSAHDEEDVKPFTRARPARPTLAIPYRGRKGSSSAPPYASPSASPPPDNAAGTSGTDSGGALPFALPPSRLSPPVPRSPSPATVPSPAPAPIRVLVPAPAPHSSPYPSPELSPEPPAFPFPSAASVSAPGPLAQPRPVCAFPSAAHAPAASRIADAPVREVKREEEEAEGEREEAWENPFAEVFALSRDAALAASSLLPLSTGKRAAPPAAAAAGAQPAQKRSCLAGHRRGVEGRRVRWSEPEREIVGCGAGAVDEVWL